jgi:Tn3 transposase DDE domain-containing protein
VPREWREAVVDEAGRVERIPYELCVLRALREAIRRREIYVCGASRWRDPEEDLPVDFEANREIHYDAIRKPLDPAVFVTDLQRRLREALDRLDGALADGSAGGVRITTRRGEPWISVPKLDKLPEPANLEAVKAEVERRWGTLDLLDVLKDADHLAGFTGEFTSVASREVMAKETLRRRLLLVLFALGTNVGIKGITDGLTEPADLGDNEATLRYVRRVFVNRDNLRRAIVRLVDATFAARDQGLWGEGTACASDSKKFGAWDANLMTEWHVRYRGPGVMIYWHVERKSVCIYSQLKACSASEVAAMLEGVMRHCTSAEVERTYVDTHGASVVGFAFAHLLGFQLLPRLKNIGGARLYCPGTDDDAWPRLARVLTRPIDWELIARQYDQLVKYATTPPPCGWARPKPSRSCAASPAAAPSTRPTPPWRNSAGRYGPSSCATTSPTRPCAGRSTKGSRSSRTGTVPTPSSTTARKASSPALTGNTRRSPCSPCTSCNRRWCTSTPCSSRGSWPSGPGRPASPARTAAGCPRCSGPTSTPTGASPWTWEPTSISPHDRTPGRGVNDDAGPGPGLAASGPGPRETPGRSGPGTPPRCAPNRPAASTCWLPLRRHG